MIQNCTNSFMYRKTVIKIHLMIQLVGNWIVSNCKLQDSDKYDLYNLYYIHIINKNYPKMRQRMTIYREKEARETSHPRRKNTGRESEKPVVRETDHETLYRS